jgi:hypothetical protein
VKLLCMFPSWDMYFESHGEVSGGEWHASGGSKA